MNIDNSVETRKWKLIEEINDQLEHGGAPASLIVPKAIRLADLCGDFEHRLLFELHLDGYDPDGGSGTRIRKWHDQSLQPKWNIVDAFYEDRHSKGRSHGASLQEIEHILSEVREQKTTLRNMGMPAGELLITTEAEISKILGRIKNRIGRFIRELETSLMQKANANDGNYPTVPQIEGLPSSDSSPDASTHPTQQSNDVDVFISHSSADVELAEALVNLLQSAMRLPSAKIRCTSVEGHRLPGGSPVEEQLRREVLSSKVFVALVTPVSLRSTYVLFEMGARWGAQCYLVPVMTSADTSILKGPLSALNALNCSIVAQVHQLVHNIADTLGIQPEPPYTYQRHIEELVRRSERAHHLEMESRAMSSRWTATRLGLTKFHVEILFWICLYSEYSTAEKIAAECRADVKDIIAAIQLLIEKSVVNADQSTDPVIYRVTAAGVDVVKSSLKVD